MAEVFYHCAKIKQSPAQCWYAAARILASAYESGPRIGHVNTWALARMAGVLAAGSGETEDISVWGLKLRNLAEFAASEGLTRVLCDVRALEPSAFVKVLRENGPLWVWRVFESGAQDFHHAYVINGATDEAEEAGATVSYIEPFDGLQHRVSFEEIRPMIRPDRVLSRGYAPRTNYGLKTHAFSNAA